MNLNINTSLVHKLISSQFPQWKNLSIISVKQNGWDNRTFHLGNNMIVRLPSAPQYAEQVKKEQYWLPLLALHLPLAIPKPLTMGKPTRDYPFYWSIYQWIDGETASKENISDLNQFAKDLAHFLNTLENIDTTNGPIAGSHNFYRGGPLQIYDQEMQYAIKQLTHKVDIDSAIQIWNKALASSWNKAPVWVHGDIAPTNLLVKNGELSAIIDFGCLGIGDPACDYAIVWSFLDGKSRNVFRTALSINDETWSRARGWALWKAIITYAQLPGTNSQAIKKSKHIIDAIITEYKNQKLKEENKKFSPFSIY